MKKYQKMKASIFFIIDLQILQKKFIYNFVKKYKKLGKIIYFSHFFQKIHTLKNKTLVEKNSRLRLFYEIIYADCGDHA